METPMDMVVCPHCKTHRLVTSKISKDMIVFMSCPACQELSVLFHGRVIPLNRQVLESGSFDERRHHIAEVITHFLEAGFSIFGEGDETKDSPFNHLFSMGKRGGAQQRQPQPDLITEEELDRFTRIELKRLDNPTYFKRHFG